MLGGRRQQLCRRAVDLRCGLRNPCDGTLYVTHQLTQLFDGVVDRVSNGTGDVFGHRCFLRQVAFGDRLQLIHQSQNGRLVGIVDTLGVLLLAFSFLALPLCDGLTLLAVLHLQSGQTRRTNEGDCCGKNQNGQ